MTRNRHSIAVVGTKRGGEPVDETFSLDPKIPLIMEEHPMAEFIKSPKKEMLSCLIHPNDIKLIELRTEKVGEEILPDFGRTIKTVSRMTTFFFDHFDAGYAWCSVAR